MCLFVSIFLCISLSVYRNVCISVSVCVLMRLCVCASQNKCSYRANMSDKRESEVGKMNTNGGVGGRGTLIPGVCAGR